MIQAIFLWILIPLIIINKSIAQNCEQVGCAPGFCCSKWGFCGDTPLHCATSNNQTNQTYGIACQPPCGPNSCCSAWGFCGSTLLHCAGGSGQTNDTYIATCQPPCGPNFCCSRWGFCGDTPLHCAGTAIQTNDTYIIDCQPPCRSGFCCSRWGFCGDTPLHCSGGGIIYPPSTAVPPIEENRCPPPCPAGLCCSKWGFCGSSPLHCDGSDVTTTAVATLTPTITTSPIVNRPCPPPCPKGYCCSQWGFCGNTPEYCTSTSGGNGNNPGITREQFDCIFDELDPELRDRRWQGFQEALTMVPFNQQNQNEVMMFFAHVAHETDGLKTYEEYCGQSGACADDYQSSWCYPVQGEPGKTYYGRGWFQLSWPCNYHNAGQALGIDFLRNPEKVAESDKLAAATAIWFWNANGMAQPARNGNFAGTTQIINRIECGPTPQQKNRIKRYQKVRKCFGLDEATDNLQC